MHLPFGWAYSCMHTETINNNLEDFSNGLHDSVLSWKPVKNTSTKSLAKSRLSYIRACIYTDRLATNFFSHLKKLIVLKNKLILVPLFPFSESYVLYS